MAGCSAAGLVFGAAGSNLTRRFLLHRTARVLSSWWVGAIVTAAVFGVLSWRVGARWELAVYTFVVVLGVPLGIIDGVEHRLPRLLVGLTFAGAVAGFGLLCLIRHDLGPALRAMLAALVLSGVLLMLAVLVPGGIGAGDVRLAAVIGLVTGWSGWPVVTGAMTVALLLALLLAVITTLRRRGNPETAPVAVPFGPCLLTGLLVAVAAAGG